MPRTWSPATTGESPTTGADVARRASRTPGTPRIVPTETTGFEGGTSTTVSIRDGVDHTGTGGRRLDADRDDRAGRHLGVQPDPVLLEVDGATPRRLGGVVDDDVRLDPVVGHRQQPDPGLPATAERLGHRGQRVAGLEHLGADQVGGEVPVAEAEPGRLHAVRRQLLLGVPGLVRAAPAALGVDAAAEGVHHGVQVGTDLQPVQPDVVGGVGHHGDLGACRCPARCRPSRCSRPCRKRAPPTPPDSTVTEVTGLREPSGRGQRSWAFLSRWHTAGSNVWRVGPFSRPRLDLPGTTDV